MYDQETQKAALVLGQLTVELFGAVVAGNRTEVNRLLVDVVRCVNYLAALVEGKA